MPSALQTFWDTSPARFDILLAVFGSYFGLLLAMRHVALWRLRLRMAALSVAEADGPVAEVAPPRPPAVALQFHRVDGQVLPAQAQAARDAAAASALRLFRVSNGVDLVLAFVGLGMALDWIATRGTWLRGAPVQTLALLTLYLVVLRYPVHRRAHLGHRGWVRNLLSGPLGWVAMFTSPRWQPVVRLALLVSALHAMVQLHQQSAGAAMLMALGLPTALLLAWMVWLNRRGQRLPGVPLLFLRVFGGQQSAEFTFSGLLERWRSYGTYFCVIDTVRLQQHARIWHWGRYVTAGCLWQTSMTTMFWTLGPVCLLMLGLLAVEWWLVYAPIFRVSVTSRAGLDRLLDATARKPRMADLGFRSLELPCFDNTWRFTVAAVAARVPVIVMDLRDYTPGRAGAEYEVGFLLDTEPLSKLLILVGSAEAIPQIEKLLRSRWQTLAAASPNRALLAPSVGLYDTGAESADDMQHLLDALIGMAATAAATGTGPAAAPRLVSMPAAA